MKLFSHYQAENNDSPAFRVSILWIEDERFCQVDQCFFFVFFFAYSVERGRMWRWVLLCVTLALPGNKSNNNSLPS